MSNENQEVALIEDITEDKAPAIYGHNKLDGYYDAVKEKVNEVPDLSTAKGRARIASLSAKVSSSKAAVEKPGRAYLGKIKELPKKIEAELRDFVTKMDALRDEVRRPLTEWDAEQKRIEEEKAAAEAAAEAQRLAEIATRELQEQVDRDHELAIFMYADYLRDQEEARKQAIIDAENAAKAQKEREEQIAKEAAENARIEAEREAQAAIDRAEREKVEAENARLRQEQQAKDAAIKAEQDRLAAIAQAEADKQAAIEDERKRQADAAEAERLAAEQREKNKAHAKKINNEIFQDFMAQGLSEECAKTAITAMAKGLVRNVKVLY